jgi:hypothetical protein
VIFRTKAIKNAITNAYMKRTQSQKADTGNQKLTRLSPWWSQNFEALPFHSPTGNDCREIPLAFHSSNKASATSESIRSNIGEIMRN